ncbi:MAG: AmmeMemoRadiSam system protein B, partial [Candidatus Omnitrophica bacterium]|nr:AmmeMemoRadiSam system protein B [Candidatus Omnitrophota bacterium]
IAKVLPKKKIIILGPNHTGLGSDFSLWAKGSWKIFSETIAIDEKIAEIILNKGNLIEEDYLAHSQEHSIEVELPILQYFFKQFEFLPICCRQSDIKIYQAVATQIFEAIKEEKNDILMVASTDLTHYEPDQTARKKDRLAIDAIINLDEQELINRIRKERITMCGEAPVAILIACLKKIGAQKAQIVLYQTSADASKDKSSVVGYAGLIIK